MVLGGSWLQRNMSKLAGPEADLLAPSLHGRLLGLQHLQLTQPLLLILWVLGRCTCSSVGKGADFCWLSVSLE